MPYQKGESGNLRGRPPIKPFSDALRKAVHELRTADAEDKPRKIKALRLLARRLVSKGLDGDIPALKEIADRLDGRSVQGVVLDLAVTVTAIERVIVDPQLAGPVIDAIVVEDDEASDS